MRRFILPVLALAVVAGGVLLGVNLSSGTAGAKPTVHLAAPTARSAIRLAESGRNYATVKRSAAKLVTVSDIEAKYPGVMVASWAMISHEKVWVVAVSGDPRYIGEFSATPQHYNWGVSVIDPRTGTPIAQFAGSDARHWPSYFASLPNLSVSP